MNKFIKLTTSAIVALLVIGTLSSTTFAEIGGYNVPNLVARQEPDYPTAVATTPGIGSISSILSDVSTPTETPDPETSTIPTPSSDDPSEVGGAGGIPDAYPPAPVDTGAATAVPTPSASPSASPLAYSAYSSPPTAPTGSIAPIAPIASTKSPYSPAATTKKPETTSSAANKVENSLLGIIIAGVFSLLL